MRDKKGGAKREANSKRTLKVGRKGIVGAKGPSPKNGSTYWFNPIQNVVFRNNGDPILPPEFVLRDLGWPPRSNKNGKKNTSTTAGSFPVENHRVTKGKGGGKN